MNGNVFNLFLSKNSTTSEAIVNPRVITLKLSKVIFKLSRGFVNAVEFAAVKKALMF